MSFKSDQYSHRGITFILVYVEEAHAIETEDWPDSKMKLQMKLPTNIEEKLSNASVLGEHTKVPIYVDTTDNLGESLYGAHPER